MARNTLKEKESPPEKTAAPPRKSSRRARKLIRFMRVFGIFNRHQVVMMMPFILFLTVLILFYIGNSYYSERTVRNINNVKNELKEKRAEFISTSSELMFRTKQSEVARAIAPMEIKESVEPQKKISIVPEKKNNND